MKKSFSEDVVLRHSVCETLREMQTEMLGALSRMAKEVQAGDAKGVPTAGT